MTEVDEVKQQRRMEIIKISTAILKAIPEDAEIPLVLLALQKVSMNLTNCLIDALDGDEDEL